MEILYVYYAVAGKPARYILLLYLGEHNGKLSGIATDAISNGDRQRILSQATRLAGLSLERKLEWLRTHCPEAIRNGYRAIHKHNISIISRHPIQARI
jgi:hypothetical protein